MACSHRQMLKKPHENILFGNLGEVPIFVAPYPVLIHHSHGNNLTYIIAKETLCWVIATNEIHRSSKNKCQLPS